MSHKVSKIGKQEIELMKLIYEKNIIEGRIIKYDDLVEKPLVSSHIINNLRTHGFIHIDNNKNIFLTNQGAYFILKYLDYVSKRLEHRDRMIFNLLLIIVTSFTATQYLGAKGIILIIYTVVGVFVYLSLQYYERKRSQLSKIEEYIME